MPLGEEYSRIAQHKFFIRGVSMMYYGKKTMIFSCLAAILAGGVLHFLYGVLPCAITSLFAPVNQSLFEQIKMLYWPFLITALLLNRQRTGAMYPWCFALLCMCALKLALSWGYQVVFRGEAQWVEVALFVACMIFGFWLASMFGGPFKQVRWIFAVIVVVVLGVIIALFTLWPPEGLLFADLSTAGAWFPLPI